jgi:hypothetical protein
MLFFYVDSGSYGVVHGGKFMLALVWNQYKHWLLLRGGRNAHVKQTGVDRNAIKASSLYKIALLVATDKKGYAIAQLVEVEHD